MSSICCSSGAVSSPCLHLRTTNAISASILLDRSRMLSSAVPADLSSSSRVGEALFGMCMRLEVPPVIAATGGRGVLSGAAPASLDVGGGLCSAATGWVDEEEEDGDVSSTRSPSSSTSRACCGVLLTVVVKCTASTVARFPAGFGRLSSVMVAAVKEGKPTV